MTLWGTLSGAILIGGGGRASMRVLAYAIGDQPVFDLGGTAEVIAYGAIVGALAGVAVALCARWMPRTGWQRALLIGSATFAATALTLPAHITPLLDRFSQQRLLVVALFGLCFLAFGWTLAMCARMPKH